MDTIIKKQAGNEDVTEEKDMLASEDVAGTAPAEETEEQPDVNLSSDTVATEEEQEAANLGVMESSTEKMFTQSQVDEIAGKARKEGRERALRDEYARYGVNSMDELDDLFGDAQRFSTLQGKYDTDKAAWEEMDKARAMELNDVKEKLALLESGIDKSRYEDAKLILKGKGLEITVDNITKELEGHPEWKGLQVNSKVLDGELPFRKKESMNNTEPSTSIKVLGNSGEDVKSPEQTEYDKAMGMFFRK